MAKGRPAASPALLALTASALAALAPASRARAQDAPSDESNVAYRYSNYREGTLPANQVSGGNGERYTIHTHQFRLVQPLDERHQFSAGLTWETMSGASPWYVQPVAGRPVQVMSGASIRDQRVDLALGLSRQVGRTRATVSGGYSKEDDYAATNLGLQGEWQLADTVTTFSAGVGYSDDRLEPTQGATAVSTTAADRRATTAFAGLARVLGPLTVVQAGLGYTLHDGFLSDPYKAAWVEDDPEFTVPDSRPDSRAQFSGTARLRQSVKGADAALHLDYRFYRDDWEVNAHTLDLAWHQRLGEHLRLVPGARYYSQSQAAFYAPYYATERADGLASSDYRLSPYGALSLSLAAYIELAGWGLNLRYEDYDSGAAYALGEVEVENPGLVDFRVVSLGLGRTF